MSNSGTRPALRERVATAIVEAAAGVLANRGDHASMSDVATAAGVARATVYRYFPNREALLEALGRLALEDVGDRLDAARLDEVDVADALERSVRALVTVGDGFVVVARDRGRPANAAFEDRIAAPVRDLLARGQRDERIRRTFPPRGSPRRCSAWSSTSSGLGPGSGPMTPSPRSQACSSTAPGRGVWRETDRETRHGG